MHELEAELKIGCIVFLQNHTGVLQIADDVSNLILFFFCYS